MLAEPVKMTLKRVQNEISNFFHWYIISRSERNFSPAEPMKEREKRASQKISKKTRDRENENNFSTQFFFSANKS
jgi:hypothetical protein